MLGRTANSSFPSIFRVSLLLSLVAAIALSVVRKPASGLADSLENFMSNQHEDLAPEETAHEYLEELKANFSVPSPQDLVEAVGDNLMEMEEGVEDFVTNPGLPSFNVKGFIESQHTDLKPSVTAHDVEEQLGVLDKLEQIEEQIEEVVEEAVDDLTGADEKQPGPGATSSDA